MLAEDTKGLVKLIVLKDGHIVGASLMGPNVTDYVAELGFKDYRKENLRNCINSRNSPTPNI